jgi:hypothetical protein
MIDERLASVVVQKAPYAAAGGTGIAVFTLNEWAMIVGIVVTILTFVLNWYYKRKDEKRKQIEHELAVAGRIERRKPYEEELDG